MENVLKMFQAVSTFYISIEYSEYYMLQVLNCYVWFTRTYRIYTKISYMHYAAYADIKCF